MKNYLIRYSLLFLFGVLCLVPAKAQEPEWTLLEELSGVKIYRAYITCEEKPYVLLKVENLTNNDVAVSWKSKFVMMGKDVLTEDNRIVTVKALSTSVGDCQSSSLKVDPYQYVSLLKAGISDYYVSGLSIN